MAPEEICSQSSLEMVTFCLNPTPFASNLSYFYLCGSGTTTFLNTDPICGSSTLAFREKK